ncbi:MAG TPA: DUF6616 family protein [Bacillota bacterium]
MGAQERPLGFFAAWKATDTWFRTSEKEKAQFMKEIEKIFNVAKEKGVKMHGVYDCSWSSEWRYFTFWECPNLEILEETMGKLAAIGDINMYNEQRHFIGRLIPEEVIQ